MKFGLSFFTVLVFQSQSRQNVVNIFVNKPDNYIGYLDRKGNIFSLNSETPVKRIGKLQWNEDGIYYKDDLRWYETKMKKRGHVSWPHHSIKTYFENEKQWMVQSSLNYWWDSNEQKVARNTFNSTCIYQNFHNNSFFRIYMNGIVCNSSDHSYYFSHYDGLWTAVALCNSDFLLTMDENNYFKVIRLTDHSEIYTSQIMVSVPSTKITINQEGNFIHVFVLFPNRGVQVIKFYGGFHSFTSSFFIPIPNSEHMTSFYPYLSVLDKDAKLYIYHIQNNDSYDLKYCSKIQVLSTTLEQFEQYKSTLYAHDGKKLYKIIYIL